MKAKHFAEQAVRKLRDAGFEALWAGGCVRDLVLGKEPADYDVATSATPVQVRELFGRSQTVAVGIAFGVIIVKDHAGSGEQIEVATFRTDASYSDGRRPDSVEFSTPEEDAKRRDFTINGMFYDPVAGKVIDFVGGQADLAQGLIRAIGSAEARIAEDKLRMLRAVRFAARFEFEIEPSTRIAIRENSSQVSIVSGERIAIELQKTLSTARAAWAIREWCELGLLAEFLPSLGPAKVEFDEEQLSNISVRVERINSASWQAKLTCVLQEVLQCDSKVSPSREALRNLQAGLKERLKLSNSDIQAMVFALESHSALWNALSAPWSQIQPYLIRQEIGTAVELLTACDAGEATLAWIGERLSWQGARLNPPSLLTGEDILEMGEPPGQRIRWLLAECRQKQLDGLLDSRDSALLWCAEKLASK